MFEYWIFSTIKFRSTTYKNDMKKRPKKWFWIIEHLQHGPLAYYRPSAAAITYEKQTPALKKWNKPVVSARGGTPAILALFPSFRREFSGSGNQIRAIWWLRYASPTNAPHYIQIGAKKVHFSIGCSLRIVGRWVN